MNTTPLLMQDNTQKEILDKPTLRNDSQSFPQSTPSLHMPQVTTDATSPSRLLRPSAQNQIRRNSPITETSSPPSKEPPTPNDKVMQSSPTKDIINLTPISNSIILAKSVTIKDVSSSMKRQSSISKVNKGLMLVGCRKVY